MELEDWIAAKNGIVSIDADFFTHPEEQRLAPRVERWLEQQAAAGVRIVVAEEHVDLVEVVSQPVDFILNFDFHMDCRLEFLHGDAPRTPPCSASVFETLLARGLTERYVWAFPTARSRHAALAYSSGFVAGRQPLLTRIHCVSARHALDSLLRLAAIATIFVCRSPDYATAKSDAIYERLRSLHFVAR